MKIQLCPTGHGMRAPFGATTLAGEERSRINFDLQIDRDELLRCARGFDEWFVAQLSADSERLMSRPMTPADV